MEEKTIIELYFNRDERAIEETEKSYGKLCKNIAKRILGDEHDAEECTNDVYLGLWNAIPPERPASLMAFVARIARNHALTRLKYKSAAKRNSDVLVSLSELEDVIPDGNVFEEVEDRDLGAMISDFLYSQREEARTVFVRKYWYFDSIATIAERYGCSETKVKSILFRTRKKLKHYLSEKGVAL